MNLIFIFLHCIYLQYYDNKKNAFPAEAIIA